MKHIEVVCAIIKDKEGRYFCCKRGPGRALEGYWEFPGGKIEQGETKEQSLVRELKEELKILIKPLRYVGVSHYDYVNLEKPFSLTMYAYICELLDGNIVLTEHVDMAWKTKDEMVKMNFAPADFPIIEML